MQKILLLLVLTCVAFSNNYLNVKYRNFLGGQGLFEQKIAETIYNQFVSPYNEKSNYRFQLFKDTLIEIRNHNMGRHSWEQGINDFSDMTFEEFKEAHLMDPQQCSATHNLEVSPKEDFKIPDAYEWNNYGMVTPVKNQGQCGSCWTFSTIGAMESHWNILGKGRNLTFSEQQLVDCADDFDNHGCNGGLPSHAFEYIRYTGGLQSDLTYPYVAKTNKCVHRPGISVAYVKYGSFNITKGDQNQLADRLFNVGPISIAFQVASSFRNYKSGVYSGNDCGSTTKDVNHAVLATGYGIQGGKKYWNVKNSWGNTWGMSGYFKIERGVNMCAVAMCNSYPLIDSLDGLQKTTPLQQN